MRNTIEALLTNKPVQQWYEAAAKHWNEILKEVDETDPKALAEVASREQFWFEENCGGRWTGQEIMVVTAIARYVIGPTPNYEKAHAMYKGLINSKCSSEIHSHARQIARILSLDVDT